MIAEALRQCSVDSLADQVWDVLIVGAGPAGATAATQLARHGHRVVMVDRHSFPRDKVCGDILIPDALHALERLKLLPQAEALGRSLSAASIYSPSRIEVRISGRFLTLRRRCLDTLVARAAVDAGATFSLGQVNTLQNEAAYVVAHCSGGKQVRARLGLIATGADTSLLFRAGTAQNRQGNAVAMRQYVRSPLPLDRLIFAYDRSTVPGYAWMTPLGDGLFNVGCGVVTTDRPRTKVNLHALLRRFVRDFPLARELMRGCESLSPLRGAALRCGLDTATAPMVKNVLAIGETIAATYPFTGEGVGKAMETAELAGQLVHAALQEGRPQILEHFSRDLEDQLRVRYSGYHVAQRWLSKPWLNDLVMRRVSRSGFLQRALAGIVDETVDPQAIFSLRGLLKSLWC